MELIEISQRFSSVKEESKKKAYVFHTRISFSRDLCIYKTYGNAIR